ncbi:hypothetical protein ACMD2_11015 [Ananas comosus]|uniref:Uncharacterized protein n=1 Tax=Ananas comosus TaxID=4615 RepID=A0A199W143_ANACO|nr:hypothetical protein ACMD2_11015 [Ananas comosus]
MDQPPRFGMRGATKQIHKQLSVSYWYGRFATHANLGFTAPLDFLEDVEVQQLISLLHTTPLSDASIDSPSWRWAASGPSIGDLILMDDSVWELGDRWSKARRTLFGRNKAFFDLVFSACCWDLWNERNKRIFDNHSRTHDVLGRNILTTTRLWDSTLGARRS